MIGGEPNPELANRIEGLLRDADEPALPAEVIAARHGGVRTTDVRSALAGHTRFEGWSFPFHGRVVNLWRVRPVDAGYEEVDAVRGRYGSAENKGAHSIGERVTAMLSDQIAAGNLEFPDEFRVVLEVAEGSDD